MHVIFATPPPPIPRLCSLAWLVFSLPRTLFIIHTFHIRHPQPRPRHLPSVPDNCTPHTPPPCSVCWPGPTRPAPWSCTSTAGLPVRPGPGPAPLVSPRPTWTPCSPACPTTRSCPWPPATTTTPPRSGHGSWSCGRPSTPSTWTRARHPGTSGSSCASGTSGPRLAPASLCSGGGDGERGERGRGGRQGYRLGGGGGLFVRRAGCASAGCT